MTSAAFNVTRAVFCATITNYSMRIGEFITVDLAVSGIQASMKGGDKGFVLPILKSVLRGKSIVDVLPKAQEWGKFVGALTASICAPTAYEYLYPKYQRVYLTLTEAKPQITASRGDYGCVVASVGVIVVIFFDLVRNFKYLLTNNC